MSEKSNYLWDTSPGNQVTWLLDWVGVSGHLQLWPSNNKVLVLYRLVFCNSSSSHKSDQLIAHCEYKGHTYYISKRQVNRQHTRQVSSSHITLKFGTLVVQILKFIEISKSITLKSLAFRWRHFKVNICCAHH